jgi:hypothetical protein
MVIVLLTGCQTKVVKNKNNEFDKKQECASHKEKIQKELDNKIGLNVFHEIFYSPILNTCLYTYASDSGYRYIVDYFTNETIFSSTDIIEHAIKRDELKK